MKKMITSKRLPFSVILICFTFCAHAQQVTGVWKGKIDKKKVEVKIIQKGDSLTGTSYYYESAGNYRRYSIKGYFDQRSNSVVWWDDQLLEEKSNSGGKQPLLSVADFNCPGGGEMFLDGKAALKEDRDNIKGPVALQKTNSSQFPDDWDFIIDNYMVGGNDPELIDSIAALAIHQPPAEKSNIKSVEANNDMVFIPAPKEKKIELKKEPQKTIETAPPVAIAKPVSIEEKLGTRKKVLTKEIMLAGDSVELRFYDNAEVDGDSITLFLNDKMIFQHIRLTEKAFTIKLPVTELIVHNELVMVAENLGSIPPNTSYMVCLVGDKRYEANLTSTEGSSAMIRFVRSE